MNSFWQSIIRISSLGIIVILLYFGVDLMKNTNGTSFAGSGLIFVGITLAVISFIDWRKREDYEHLIKQQGAVIKDLGQQISEKVFAWVTPPEAALFLIPALWPW